MIFQRDKRREPTVGATDNENVGGDRRCRLGERRKRRHHQTKIKTFLSERYSQNLLEEIGGWANIYICTSDAAGLRQENRPIQLRQLACLEKAAESELPTDTSGPFGDSLTENAMTGFGGS